MAANRFDVRLYRRIIYYFITVCSEIKRELVPKDVERDGRVKPDGVHQEQPGRRGQGVERQRPVRVFHGIVEYRVSDGTELQPDADRQHAGLQGIRHRHADE